jgi:hypothetical protein
MQKTPTAESMQRVIVLIIIICIFACPAFDSGTILKAVGRISIDGQNAAAEIH